MNCESNDSVVFVNPEIAPTQEHLLNSYISAMNPKCFLAFLTFWFGMVNVNAQNHDLLDSLNRAYQVAEHDTEKINCLFAIGEELIGPDPDTVLIIEKKAWELAEKNLASDLTEKLRRKYMGFPAAAIAALIPPLHSVFESKVKGKLIMRG